MRTDYDTLVDDIATRADIGNLASAERAAIETLLAFGRFIPAGQADALGVVLPGALGDAVTESRTDTPERQSVEWFVSAVADGQGFGVDDAQAIRHIRAVMATIAAHGGHDELRQTREHLPEEFAPLFEGIGVAG
jgi:uncharacterized protein (DUF2267 family)